jgi:hypothetical protein
MRRPNGEHSTRIIDQEELRVSHRGAETQQLQQQQHVSHRGAETLQLQLYLLTATATACLAQSHKDTERAKAFGALTHQLLQSLCLCGSVRDCS